MTLGPPFCLPLLNPPPPLLPWCRHNRSHRSLSSQALPTPAPPRESISGSASSARLTPDSRTTSPAAVLPNERGPYTQPSRDASTPTSREETEPKRRSGPGILGNVVQRQE
ncbi:hypothetical protein A6R68_18910, partial [Neotoma lepida]